MTRSFLVFLAIIAFSFAPTSAFAQIAQVQIPFISSSASDAPMQSYWEDFRQKEGLSQFATEIRTGTVTGADGRVLTVTLYVSPTMCGKDCPMRIYENDRLIVDTNVCLGYRGYSISPDLGIFYDCANLGHPIADWLIQQPRQATNTLASWAADHEWNHNGSVMAISPSDGTITYASPKQSLAGTVSPGQVLFEGDAWAPGGPFSGTAYTFRKGCEPAPYAVEATYEGYSEILTLRGAAPVRERGGCKVVGYDETSANAVLQFDGTFD